VGISVVIGLALGTLAGYYQGALDTWISRFADLLLAFPFLIFAIGVMAFMGPGFMNLILALTFKGWVEFYRLARGEMLSEKTQEYVEAAKVTGHSHAAIIVREILPNIIQSVFVLGTLRIGYMIIMEASLSFLGLGIPPHIPAWGSMVAAGRDYMLVAPWVSTYPGLAIVGLVLSINLFGEGLRDILDPRLRIE
jgi:peptide/nickel transport system permease protein